MATAMKTQTESPFPKGVARPAQRALASLGIYRLEDVTTVTERELLALHGMGPTAVEAIKAALQAQGKSLKS